MKKSFKSESGISGIDIITSIGIIIVFSMIITAVYTNLTSSNVRIQRTQIATNYAVALMEKADKLYYDELSEDKLRDKMNFARKYDVHVEVNERELQGELVKEVSVDVGFSVGKKADSVKMEKIKKKEPLESPNKPVLENNMVPAKYVESELIKTNENDSDWYDYANKKWAYAVYGNNMNNVLVWIPKYAFIGNDVEFVFGKGTRFINQQGLLEELGENYQIFENFNDKDGIWVNKSDIKTNIISSVLNSSPKYGLD